MTSLANYEKSQKEFLVWCYEQGDKSPFFPLSITSLEDDIQLLEYGTNEHLDRLEKEKEITEKRVNSFFLRVDEVKDTLAHIDDDFKSMGTVLDDFVSRLSTMEKGIEKVHGDTQQLNIAKKNLEQTILVLKGFLDMFQLNGKIESDILAGFPTSKNETEIENYLNLLDELDSAIQFMQENHSFKSAEKCLGDLRKLADKAMESCASIFKDELSSHSKPIIPIGISKYSSKLITESPTKKKNLKLGRASSFVGMYNYLFIESIEDLALGEECMKLLSLLVSRFGMFNYKGYLQDYKNIRSTWLKDSFLSFVPKNFESEAKEATIGSFYALLGNSNVKKIDSNWNLYEKDSHFYVTIIEVLSTLLEFEKKLAFTILPRIEVDSVVIQLFNDGIQRFISIGEEILKEKKESKTRVYRLLNIYNTLEYYFPNYRKQLIDVDENHYQLLKNIELLVSSFKSATLKELHELESSIFTRGGNAYEDGTVHEITTNTLNLIKLLIPYKVIINRILKEEESEPNFKNEPFVSYSILLLNNLKEHLLNKSNEYKSEALGSIFLLNNYAHQIKILQGPVLANIFDKEIEEKLEKDIEQVIHKYQSQTWDTILLTIMNQAIIPSNSMKKKERQKVKDMFAKFNKELEEVTRTQKSFHIPNSAVRKQLKSENQILIVPMYESFLARWKDSNYSKNREKHEKYTVQDVTSKLDKMYEGR